MSKYIAVSIRLVVLKSKLGLKSRFESIFAGFRHAYQGLILALRHPKIESLFKPTYKCNAITAPRTSPDLHSYYSKDHTMRAS